LNQQEEESTTAISPFIAVSHIVQEDDFRKWRTTAKKIRM